MVRKVTETGVRLLRLGMCEELTGGTEMVPYWEIDRRTALVGFGLPANQRETILNGDKQSLSQRPITLPTASAPK